LRQLSWIQDRFTVLHPLEIEHGEVPPRSALLTFDDGFVSFREIALPILETARLPAIVFLNMDVVEGSPNSAALAVWSCRRNGHVRNPWEESLPQKYERSLESLESSGEWAAFQEFQGTFLDKVDVAALDGHPLVAFGSHLSNHWHSPSLNDREFDEAVMTNQRRLQAYRNGMPWLAYPFGVGTPHLDERAEAHGVTRVFTGRGLLNPEPSQKVLHRVDLNGEIRNRLLFRWRLSTRTAFAGLRGLVG
jgi:peptidoglycan/xylan/chitin deacetylase (PgdA/CDA1 family)